MGSEVDIGGSANLALLRDLKTSRQGRDAKIWMETERDSAGYKLLGKMSEFRCRFNDQAMPLKKTTQSNRELTKEVRDFQVARKEERERLLEERNRTVTDTVKFNSRDHELKTSEVERNMVAAELERITGLYNAIEAGGAGSSSSTRVHRIASSARAELENLSREVQKGTKRACEGLDTTEEAVDRTEVKEENAVELVAGGSLSSSAHSTPHPPPSSEGLVRTRT